VVGVDLDLAYIRRQGHLQALDQHTLGHTSVRDSMYNQRGRVQTKNYRGPI
jgi:hypothetical protein